jgi:hypothetical protein
MDRARAAVLTTKPPEQRTVLAAAARALYDAGSAYDAPATWDPDGAGS